MFSVHEQSSGGYVSGEDKLAITVRNLAGGNQLDLGT